VRSQDGQSREDSFSSWARPSDTMRLRSTPPWGVIRLASGADAWGGCGESRASKVATARSWRLDVSRPTVQP
jgi:hypothetical protein